MLEPPKGLGSYEAIRRSVTSYDEAENAKMLTNINLNEKLHYAAVGVPRAGSMNKVENVFLKKRIRILSDIKLLDDFKVEPGFWKNVMGIEAVSYTHLDVYKRQVLEIFLNNSNKN